MPKYKKRADGRFATRVYTGVIKDGKKQYVTLYSDKSSRDLETKVAEYCQKRDSGSLTEDTETSMYDYALLWLKNEKAFAEDNTKQMYSNIIQYHLKDLQHHTFEFFTLNFIQGIINERADKPRTCQQIKLTLKQIGKSAEYSKLLPIGTTEQIFDRIKLPKYRKKEKRPLTDEEKAILTTGNFTPREKAFVYILYYTGLRREEVLALSKADIKGGYINVNKALSVADSGSHIKYPKTERGFRKVPIPKALQDVLDDYTKDMQDTDILFQKQTGGYMTHDSYRRLWDSIRSKFGTDITAHLFRHNYCTMLCYQSATKHNITSKKIAELLGDTEMMVIEVYSHIVDSLESPEEAISGALDL